MLLEEVYEKLFDSIVFKKLKQFTKVYTACLNGVGCAPFTFYTG